MRQRIREIAADGLGVPAEELPLDASTETVAAWDSLHHLELMLAIEVELGVHVPAEAMAELLSIDAIVEHLAGPGVAEAA